MSTFECHVERSSGAGTLHLRGQVDFAAIPSLTAASARLLADPRVPVIRVDCAEVVFFDCAALGALLELDAEASARGKVLCLRDVPHCVRRVLALTRTESAFAIVDHE